MTLMTVCVYQNDESEYIDWITKNPDGFVVNTRQALDPDYLVLHRASCPTMHTYRGMDDNPGGFTERGYQKICATSAGDLERFLISATGNRRPFTKHCTRCNAMRPETLPKGALPTGSTAPGDVIPRAREGKRSLLLRRIFATPFYLSLIAYMVNPSWMDWSSLSLPTWLRWLGVLLGLGTPPVVYWVVSTLGKNISETVFTREHHELVMHGPYRWVRHPLYAVATVIFVSLGIVAANWFFIGILHCSKINC